MSDVRHRAAVAEELLLIERELRLLDWWAQTPPEAWRLQSAAPFCVDSLTLEQWLQWIFLPRMKVLVEEGAPLPASCAILPVAELSWREHDSRLLGGLLASLKAMDSLLGGH